ncbi:MAG: hypothetical protein ACO1OK_10450, partial [Devosia sp.]
MPIPMLLGLVALLAATAPGPAQEAGTGCAEVTQACLLQEAERAAEALTRPDEQDEAAYAIAVAQSRLGQFDEALAIAAEISGGRVEAELLSAIAIDMAQFGEFDRAHAIALAVP